MFDTLKVLLKHQYSIDARLESRNSTIDHRLVSVSGARLGLAFRRKLRFGVGLSWLNSDVQSLVSTPDDPLYFKFAYVAYYMDFVFYKTKRWQLSVPIQAGTGASWFQETLPYRFHAPGKKFILLYEPGISMQYKLFKWFGGGVDFGYRFCTGDKREKAIGLNSPTFAFKILFWFDQLYYDLFPNSVITKRFGPSYW